MKIKVSLVLLQVKQQVLVVIQQKVIQRSIQLILYQIIQNALLVLHIRTRVNLPIQLTLQVGHHPRRIIALRLPLVALEVTYVLSVR